MRPSPDHIEEWKFRVFHPGNFAVQFFFVLLVLSPVGCTGGSEFLVEIGPAPVEFQEKVVEVLLPHPVPSVIASEVDDLGFVIDPHVPVQLLPDSDGLTEEVLVLLKGTTPAGSVRRFKLTSRTNLEYRPVVNVEDGVEHSGQQSFRIQTPIATYVYHKEGAGFASIYDTDGNDWLSYAPGGGPAGEYRGIPNMGYPEGYFHPGSKQSTSHLRSSGPLKASIYSESKDGNWACQWDIFPTYARMTVLKASDNFWFLYEGTPGGQLDLDADTCVRPTLKGPVSALLDKSWDEDIDAGKKPEEWLYFADGDRALYLLNFEDDLEIDSYWPMEGVMTVFGFGRKDLNRFLSHTPAVFSIGLLESSIYEDVFRAVSASYWEPDVRVSIK